MPTPRRCPWRRPGAQYACSCGRRRRAPARRRVPGRRRGGPPYAGGDREHRRGAGPPTPAAGCGCAPCWRRGGEGRDRLDPAGPRRLHPAPPTWWWTRTRTLTLRRGTDVLLSAPVGVGTPDAPTPAGEFYVRNKLTRYRSPALRARRVRHQRVVADAHRLAGGRVRGHPRHGPARPAAGRVCPTGASACATPTSCGWRAPGDRHPDQHRVAMNRHLTPIAASSSPPFWASRRVSASRPRPVSPTCRSTCRRCRSTSRPCPSPPIPHRPRPTRRRRHPTRRRRRPTRHRPRPTRRRRHPTRHRRHRTRRRPRHDPTPTDAAPRCSRAGRVVPSGGPAPDGAVNTPAPGVTTPAGPGATPRQVGPNRAPGAIAGGSGPTATGPGGLWSQYPLGTPARGHRADRPPRARSRQHRTASFPVAPSRHRCGRHRGAAGRSVRSAGSERRDRTPARPRGRWSWSRSAPSCCWSRPPSAGTRRPRRSGASPLAAGAPSCCRSSGTEPCAGGRRPHRRVAAGGGPARRRARCAGSAVRSGPGSWSSQRLPAARRRSPRRRGTGR